MQQKHDLTFTVLSDPGNQIARQLGIVNPPRNEDARAATAAFGIDVAATNADGTDELPMPTVVIVDADGIIRWIDVRPEYAFPTEPQAILDALWPGPQLTEPPSRDRARLGTCRVTPGGHDAPGPPPGCSARPASRPRITGPARSWHR